MYIYIYIYIYINICNIKRDHTIIPHYYHKVIYTGDVENNSSIHSISEQLPKCYRIKLLKLSGQRGNDSGHDPAHEGSTSGTPFYGEIGSSTLTGSKLTSKVFANLIASNKNTFSYLAIRRPGRQTIMLCCGR